MFCLQSFEYINRLQILKGFECVVSVPVDMDGAFT